MNGPFLGTNRDGEPEGPASAGANGDDLAGTPDDEDGVTLGDLTRGANANVTVISSAASTRLDAFVDFNLDGDFADQGEKIFAGQLLNAGNNNLSFAVPATASVGNTFARFRVSIEGGLSFDGHSPNLAKWKTTPFESLSRPSKCLISAMPRIRTVPRWRPTVHATR